MNEPKRQHIIPRKYLEGFCKNGMLWIYDKKTDEFRRQTPLNTLVKKNYYTLDSNEISDKYSVEKFWSWLEGSSLPALIKLSTGKRLSQLEEAWMAAYVTLMFIRVPTYESQLNETSLTATREILMKEFNNTSLEEFEFNINKNYTLAHRMNLITELGPIIAKLDWIYQRTRKYDFITSDNPVVVSPNPYGDVQNMGFLTKGNITFFPINYKCNLAMRNVGEGIRYMKVPKRIVKWINSIILFGSDRFVIAREEQHLRALIKEAKKYNWKKPYEK